MGKIQLVSFYVLDGENHKFSNDGIYLKACNSTGKIIKVIVEIEEE